MLILILALGCSGTDKGNTTDTTGDTAGDTSTDTSTDTADSGGDTGEVVQGDATRGSSLFSSSCALCHGADGTGGNDIGGTLSSDLTVEVPSKTNPELETIITEGYGYAMPAQFSDAQDVADVIAYLRVTFP